MSAMRRVAHTIERSPVLAGVIFALVLPVITSALRERWRQKVLLATRLP